MNKKTPCVSIVIPTLDRGKVLINTLKYVSNLDYPQFEIIVVDQTDKPSQNLKKFISKNKIIKYIHLDEKGTSNAKNIGAKNSKGKIIIFLDDDVEIKNKNFIHHHLNNYRDKSIGGVGGRVLMKPFRDVSGIKEVGKFKYFGFKEITNFDANTRTNIDHVYGCNQSFRKKVFDQVGGFHTVYKGNAHLEEADLSLRVKKAGYKLVFDPLSVLIHIHAPSGGCRTKSIYELRYWLIHNYVVFYLRHFPKILFPAYCLKHYCWAVLSGLKRREYKMYKVMSSAIFDGIKYYNKIK